MVGLQGKVKSPHHSCNGCAVEGGSWRWLQMDWGRPLAAKKAGGSNSATQAGLAFGRLVLCWRGEPTHPLYTGTAHPQNHSPGLSPSPIYPCGKSRQSPEGLTQAAWQHLTRRPLRPTALPEGPESPLSHLPGHLARPTPQLPSPRSPHSGLPGRGGEGEGRRPRSALSLPSCLAPLAATFVVDAQVALGEADVVVLVLGAPGARQRRLGLVDGRVEASKALAQLLLLRRGRGRRRRGRQRRVSPR